MDNSYLLALIVILTILAVIYFGLCRGGPRTVVCPVASHIKRGATVGTFTWNPQTGTHTWSPEVRDLYGLGPEDPSAFEDFLRLLDPEDRDRVRATIRDSLSSSTGDYHVTFRVRRPDGKVKVVLTCGSVLNDDEARPILLSGIVVDVTPPSPSGVRPESPDISTPQV